MERRPWQSIIPPAHVLLPEHTPLPCINLHVDVEPRLPIYKQMYGTSLLPLKQFLQGPWPSVCTMSRHVGIKAYNLRHTTRAFAHFILAETPISGMKPTCVNILSFLIPVVQKSQDMRATQHMQRMFRRRGRPSLAPDSAPHRGEAIGLIGARTHDGHIITAGKYAMTNGNPRLITRW